MDNPFVFNGYRGKEYFFDREKETHLLLQHVLSGVNVTLIAQRRMGKTGLIFRLFDELQTTTANITPIYVDIFATRDIAELNHTLASAILAAFPESSSIVHRFISMLRGLRPLVGMDPLTGTPQLQLTYQNPSEKEQTLEGLLLFLEKQDTPILLAIDEFQQIRDYKEDNIEALLRTYIQRLHNVRFIFCGSKKHMMADIFSNPQRPFFASTQFVGLDAIPAENYAHYIRKSFNDRDRQIDDEVVDFILQWTRRHTYYTQRVCHDLFALNLPHIAMADATQCCSRLLTLNEPYFLQYKQLLTSGQWNFLIALAKEQEVEQPYANAFLSHYNLGSTSVARRQLHTLIDKDLIFQETSKEGSYYTVADLFLLRWLAREY